MMIIKLLKKLVHVFQAVLRKMIIMINKKKAVKIILGVLKINNQIFSNSLVLIVIVRGIVIMKVAKTAKTAKIAKTEKITNNRDCSKSTNNSRSKLSPSLT